MENFVLYHEILKQDGVVMYKGRKKGTISYVAVSCIEKQQRVKVTNHVRLVYEMEHQHVAKFMEWYETSNHLWLVTELCVGGSLERMLFEDGPWPENAIRKFSIQLIRGLSHLHDNGIMFIMWHPSKIVLDGQGYLKFLDFSDSRKFEEDNEELVKKFFSGLNIDAKDVDELFDYNITTGYMAPELLTNSVTSPAVGYSVDVWGLGCIVFQMLTGAPPFTGNSDKELQQNILHSPLIVPKTVPQTLRKVSPELTDLLEKMLNKNPRSRISVRSLCQHKFWQGQLNCDDNEEPVSVSRRSGPPPRTPTNMTAPVSVSVAGGPDSDSASTSSQTVDEVSFTMHMGAAPSVAPSAAPAPSSDDGLLERRRTVSRPAGTAVEVDVDKDSSPDSENKSLLELVLDSGFPKTQQQHQQASRGGLDDYQRMLKDGRLKFEARQLSPLIGGAAVAPARMRQWATLSSVDRDRHRQQLEIALRQQQHQQQHQQQQARLQLLNYAGTLLLLAQDAELAEQLLPVVAEMVRLHAARSNSAGQDSSCRVCQLAAIIMYRLQPSGNSTMSRLLQEIMLALVELLRDNFRAAKMKAAAALALGETLVMMAACNAATAAEEEKAVAPEAPDTPSGLALAFTLLNRCLHRNEEVALNLTVSRTLDTIVAQHAPLSCCAVTQATTSLDCFQSLYNCFRHATTDTLRGSSATAMTQVARLQPSLLERAGSSVQQGLLLLEGVVNPGPGLIGGGGSPVPVQRALLGMLCLALHHCQYTQQQQQGSLQAGSLVRKLCLQRESTNPQRSQLLAGLAALLEASQSAAVRARALLALLLLLRQPVRTPSSANSTSRVDVMLLREVVTEARLLAHLQRRESSVQGLDDGETALHQVQQSWSRFLSEVAVPSILTEATVALEAVYGRRHPSPAQLRALQCCLPPLEVAVSLLQQPQQQQYRPALTSKLARLVLLAGHADAVGPGLLGGPDTAPQLMLHVLSLVEQALQQHGQHQSSVLELLPPLAQLAVDTASPDTRVIGLKLCGDVVQRLAVATTDEEDEDRRECGGETLRLAMDSHLLPQAAQFLQDREPSPTHLLRILRRYLALQPTHCLAAMRQHSLLHQQLLPLLADHHQQHHTVSGAVLESLLLLCSVAQADLDCIHGLMLESDLMFVVRDILLDIGDVYHQDAPTAKVTQLAQQSLETMSLLAKLISDVVRRALQARKTAVAEGGSSVAATSTAQAEELLGAGRPLTEIVGLLAHNIAGGSGAETGDSDVVEVSVRLFNQIVSLYGGQQIQHGLDRDNVACLCTAVLQGELRHRRTLLRIIKRLLASGGQASLETELVVKEMVASARQKHQSDKDTVSQSLLEEINKLVSN